MKTSSTIGLKALSIAFVMYKVFTVFTVQMVQVYIIIESYLVMLTFAASFRSAMAEAELESKLLILDLCSLLCTVHDHLL